MPYQKPAAAQERHVGTEEAFFAEFAGKRPGFRFRLAGEEPDIFGQVIRQGRYNLIVRTIPPPVMLEGEPPWEEQIRLIYKHALTWVEPMAPEK